MKSSGRCAPAIACNYGSFGLPSGRGRKSRLPELGRRVRALSLGQLEARDRCPRSRGQSDNLRFKRVASRFRRDEDNDWLPSLAALAMLLAEYVLRGNDRGSVIVAGRFAAARAGQHARSGAAHAFHLYPQGESRAQESEAILQHLGDDGHIPMAVPSTVGVEVEPSACAARS